MTYLQLCQSLRETCGIQGSGTPTTVVGQVGILYDVVNWVARAWVDVQVLRPNWNFMWAEFEFDTNATDRDYAAADVSITDLERWDTDSFLIMLKATGVSNQNELTFYTYAKWRDRYRNRMADRPDERPQLFTELPDKKIRFEPKPDDIYTIQGEYKKIAQNFTADGDTPNGLPNDLHLMIMWLALTKYGYKKAAPEKLDQAENEFDTLLFRLEADELPIFSEDFQALA